MQGFFVSFSMSQSLQHKYLSCWSICMLVQNISSLLSIPWTLAQLLFQSWAIKTIRMNKITKLKLLQHIMIEQPISKSIQWVGCFICFGILIKNKLPDPSRKENPSHSPREVSWFQYSSKRYGNSGLPTIWYDWVNRSERRIDRCISLQISVR